MAFLALLLATVGSPQAPPAWADEVGRAVAEEMSRQKIPGLAAAVVTDHRVCWSKGFGLADLENAVPVRPDTVFRLASVSKPVTAVAVAQLVEKGRIDLDAPVRAYVPDFPKKTWEVTVRHLLAHQSGVRHYTSPGEMLSTRRYGSLREALDLFKDDPLLHEPGANFTYTTYGYNLLGSAVEGASGMTFPDYVRDHIFAPSGMERSGPDDVRKVIPNRARGYQKTAAGEIRNAALIDTSNKIPGGGFLSTAEDLARFARGVLTGGLVSAETVERMFAEQKTRDGKATGHGLGWFVLLEEGRRIVRYGGTQPGTRALLFMRPDDRFAVTLLCNLEGANLDGLARRIGAVVLRSGEKK